jgi:hypothetical protein
MQQHDPTAPPDPQIRHRREVYTMWAFGIFFAVVLVALGVQAVRIYA